jgi:hypothetical protein
MILLGFVLLAVLFQSRGFNQKIYLGDEGVAAMDAWRIAQGQVPDRDFFEIIPPFSFLPTAALYALFGPSVAATRLLAFLYGLLLIFLTERLAARFTNDALARALPIAVLTPAGVAFWPIPSHHWVVDLLQLGALLLLLSGLRRGKGLSAGAAAGVLTALGCFTLQDQGAYLVVALVLFFFPWIGDKRMRRNLFLAWAVGGLAVVAIFLGYFAFEHVSFGALFYQWVIFPATRYQDINSSTMGIFAGWEEIWGLWKIGRFWPHPLYMLAMTLTEAFVWLSPLAAVAVTLAGLRAKWVPKAEMGLLAAGLAAFLGGCAHRWTLTNLQWALPLPLVLVALGLSRLRWSPRRYMAAFGLALWFACSIPAAVFAIAYFRQSAPAYTTAVRSPAGTLRTISKSEASQIQGAVDAVDELIPPNAPLFIDGYMPLISFLTLHQNPTRFSFFDYPIYNTDEQAREVMSILDGLPDAYVLASLPLRKNNMLHSYYIRHYKAIWHNEKAVILTRSADVAESKHQPEPQGPNKESR